MINEVQLKITNSTAYNLQHVTEEHVIYSTSLNKSYTLAS